MREGCISLGNVRCDGCQRTISHAERYLAVDEEDGVEVEKGKKSYYCIDCSLRKGYAEYRGEKGEKGEQKLTFFPIDLPPPEPDSEVQSPEPDAGETAGQEKKDE